MSKIKIQELLDNVEAKYKKLDIPNIHVGDTIKLGIKIEEGGKTRVQTYSGVVISKKNVGLSKTITIRKMLQGIGIERCFLIHSPKIQTIEIERSAKVRRSKLYYLRNLYGKATRLKETLK